MLSLPQLIETIGAKLYDKLLQECEAVRLNVSTPIGTAFPVRFNESDVKMVYVAILPWTVYGTEKTRNDALFMTAFLELKSDKSKISETLKRLAIEHIIEPFAQFAQHNENWANADIKGEYMSHDRWKISDTHSLLVQIMDPELFASTAIEYMSEVFSYIHFENKLQAIDDAHSMYVTKSNTSDFVTSTDFMAPFHVIGKDQITSINVPFPNVPAKYLGLIRDAILATASEKKQRIVFGPTQMPVLREVGLFPGNENTEIYYYTIKAGKFGQTFRFVLREKSLPENMITTFHTVVSQVQTENAENAEVKVQVKELENLKKENEEIKSTNIEYKINVKDLEKKTKSILGNITPDKAKSIFENPEDVRIGRSVTGAGARGGVCAVSARALLEELQSKETCDLQIVLSEDSDLIKLVEFIGSQMPSAFDNQPEVVVVNTETSQDMTPTPEMTLTRVITDLQELYETLEKTIPTKMRQEAVVANIKKHVEMALRSVHENTMSRFRPRREIVKQIRFEQMTRRLLRNLLTHGGDDAVALGHAKEIARVLSTANTHASPQEVAMLRMILGHEMNS